MKTPNKVTYLELQATCVGCTLYEWESLMMGAKRANHRQIDKLVKKHIPELYAGLFLNLYNPYNYFKTATHLILVHSGIEYFLRYKTN